MDSADLSHMAYEIIEMSDGVNDTLGSELALRAEDCQNEDEYLSLILNYINETLKAPEEHLDDIMISTQVNLIEFTQLLQDIKSKIVKTQKVPYLERGISEI